MKNVIYVREINDGWFCNRVFSEDGGATVFFDSENCPSGKGMDSLVGEIPFGTYLSVMEWVEKLKKIVPLPEYFQPYVERISESSVVVYIKTDSRVLESKISKTFYFNL